jgi:type II secretory pathway pseudopilin PulG
MESYKTNQFTLVEIVLALGIVALTLVAILPLITVVVKDSKHSISDTYVADTSEQFLHYIAGKAKNNWATYIYSDDAITSSKTDQEIEQSIADWEVIKVKVEDEDEETNLYETSNPTIYGIKQGTPAITDFIGVIRVWKSPVTSQIYSGDGWYDQKDENYEYSAGLNIEISWPTEIPYDKREKKYFYLEIFKPN